MDKSNAFPIYQPELTTFISLNSRGDNQRNCRSFPGIPASISLVPIYRVANACRAIPLLIHWCIYCFAAAVSLLQVAAIVHEMRT